MSRKPGGTTVALEPRAAFERAARGRASFVALTGSLAHDRRGVLPSEMLFLWASVGDCPQRVLESGRARGVSTQLVASLWPECPIVSFDCDGDSPDAAAARQRLAGCTNVQLRVGDSMRLLPAALEPGDVVLVDGPKGRRSLELAFRLLQSGNTPGVFVHDCFRGSPEREFLEREVPRACFSDAPEFVERFRDLDGAAWELLARTEGGSWRPFHFHGRDQQSYAATMACIPRDATTDWGRLRSRLRRRYLLKKLRNSVSKRLPHRA